MKKKLLTIALIIISSASFAQKKQKDTAKVVLPIKDGAIFYDIIIDSLHNQSKETLYKTSLKWMADSFVDSKEVIQIQDPAAGSIVGAGIFNYTPPGLLGSPQRMSFMVEITVRDNKSRIRLYQFKNKTFGSRGYRQATASEDSPYYPIDKDYYAYLQEKQFPRENRGYYQTIKGKIEGIIQSYKLFVSANRADDF